MKVQSWENMEWELVNKGLSRKIITGEKVMSAQIRLAKGTIVPEHSHPNEQISHIIQGALKFGLAGEEVIVREGEVLVIPPNVPHGALAMEETLAHDIFSPIRQDWLDHTDTYLHKTDVGDKQ
jgi:quercetin dioxygenase-like cupin family protein